MMKKRKLGIIGGSGLYKMEGFETTNWKKVATPWGKPSDEILIANLEGEEICFIPRHSRGHKINYPAPIIGGGQIILIDKNQELLIGASDWRKDGCAIGY